MSKSVLSKASTKLVDKVIGLLSIPANAKFYNQNTWGGLREGVTFNPEKFKPACDTACCIAGWMVYADSPKRYEAILRNSFVRDLYAQAYGIEGLAKRLITLKNGSFAPTSNLFSAVPDVIWPSPFSEQWVDAETPEAKAKVAVARLKHFKQTGE